MKNNINSESNVKPYIVLVIGGSGGIGKAVAEKLSQENCIVYATYHNHLQTGTCENCRNISCDVTAENEIENVVKQILEKDQRLDIVINTVTSPLKLKDFEHTTYEEFFIDIQTILLSGARILKAVIPPMKRNRNGIIITFLSEAIKTTPSRLSSYVAAKSGLSGLLGSIAHELKNSGIHFININPFFIDTPLLKAYPKKLLEIEAEELPEQRFIRPDEVALFVQKTIFDCMQNSDTYPSIKEIALHSIEDL